MSNSGGLCFVKDLFYEKSYWFSRCIFAVNTLRTLNLKFLLGDNFLDIFFYDTFFALFSFQGTKRSSAAGAGEISLVGLARLELATSRLSGVRSNHLSYRPINKHSAETIVSLERR